MCQACAGGEQLVHGSGGIVSLRAGQNSATALAARDGRALAGLRDAAILAIASDALLRTSEIAALDVSDLGAAENTVTVKRSKTDQDGAGAALFIGPPTLERLTAWIDAAGLADEEPLFISTTRPCVVFAVLGGIRMSY